jgi:transposase
VCGRYVITTSLDASKVDCTQVLGSYRRPQNLERRFKVTEDFPVLRPVFHWTEDPVRGHIPLCTLAATIKAGHGQGPCSRQGDGPGPCLPAHDA